MNPKKNNRVLKKSLIEEGLAERDEAAKETETEVVVSAPLVRNQTLESSLPVFMNLGATPQKAGNGGLLNVSEAARYLGVGRKELYRLIEWGEVDAVRAGGSLRVEMRSLETLKNGRKSYSV
jgi:excisionase family DNA binding protein